MISCPVTNYIRGSNPVWYMVDLVGKQFDDTFYMYVLTNTVPYIPATVYMDDSGTTPWGFPIQFLANGTLPINIFFAENTFYRLEIRQAVGANPPSQSDPLIYFVPDYNPSNLVTGTGTNVGGDNTINQITNPQFSAVSFSNTFTLTGVTNPPPVEVAPGWFLTLSGTGNVTVSQIPLNNALLSPTNAPYALEIHTSGWTNPPILSQRFFQNGINWSGKYIATSFTALIQGGGQIISDRLVSSNGQVLGSFTSGLLTNVFQEFKGYGLIPVSTNTTLPPASYIDYQILLPNTGDVYVTSVQLLASDNANTVEYEQDTVNRQQDYMFHYYNPKLQYKPIPSWLVGWDFPLNPAQINGSTVAAQGIANNAFYVWDQTIVYQTFAAGVAASRAANGGLTLTSAGAGQIALIQYLDATSARKILSDQSCVHMSMFGTFAGTTLAGTVSLWATTDANLPTLPTAFITTIGANGVPATFNSVNWVQVPNLTQNNSFTVKAASATNSEVNDISLNGWDMQGAAPTNTATYFAIVVGFSAWANLDALTINSIALCSGAIATRPAPKTLAATLLDCQQYFYSTFPANAAPATNYGLNTGGLQWTLVSTGRNTHFSLQYPTTMRVNPTVVIYNPAVANNQIRDISTGTDSTGSTTDANCTAKSVAITATPPGGSSVADILQAHIT